jgi:predicted MPP superfamily phosphohydrolase
MIEFRKKIKNTNLLPIFSILIIFLLTSFSYYSEKNSTSNSKEEASYIQTDNAQVSAIISENQDIAINETAPQEETQKEEIPRADLTIGIIADAHSGQEYGFSRLSSAVWSLKNYVSPDIVIDLGDLIESRFHYKNIKKNAATSDYKSASGIISRNFSTHHVIGNHEVLSMSKDDLQNLTGRKNFYSFILKGYNIMVLDANYTTKEESIDVKHADDFIYDGTLPEKQIEWLENRLKENSKNIIFIHQPLYELTNKNKIEKIIRKNKEKVIMIADGHIHPKILQIKNFGGVKEYTIPSNYFQKGVYAVIKINGSVAGVTTRK